MDDDFMSQQKLDRPTRAQFRRRLRENDKQDQDKDSNNRDSLDKPSSSNIEFGNRSRELKQGQVVQAAENISSDDIENHPLFASDEKYTPPKVLEPIRTDPVNALHARQRRLERLKMESMPEYHFIGQISSCRGIAMDSTEGVYCRWKIDHGKAYQLIGGETSGQTHVAYAANLSNEDLLFNHPLDLHLTELGVQGWGAPRILVQCSRVDWHGRRMLGGYGFVHLPTSPGFYKQDIPLWRPTGGLADEMNAFFLGNTPSLVAPDPIYDSAWRERCQLVTVSAGVVSIELYVVCRYTAEHDIDQNS